MKKIKKILFLLLISIIVLNNISLVYAKKDSAALFELSKQEIQDRIDRYIKENKNTTAGVAISVFNDRETLYNRSYGYADIENKISIEDDTVFEWGSVSKFLVWVSAKELNL